MPRFDTFPADSVLWPRLAALALAVACVGLPINHLAGYLLLLGAAVLIFTGNIAANRKFWLAAAGAAALVVAGHLLLAPPKIEEGHNVFLVDGANNALETALPEDVFRVMKAAFDRQYPPEKRCDPAIAGCWRNAGFPNRAFAFSGDGIHDRTSYSRRVTGIDFDDPVWLRLGFINDNRYNWYAGASDIQRLSRDGRFWMGLHRWHVTMPWYVMYRFPAAFAGSALCWRGTVLWESEGQRFDAINHAASECRTLEPRDAGRRMFGMAIEEDTLAMKLQPRLQIQMQRTLAALLMFAGVIVVLTALVRRGRNVILPLILIAGALLVIGVDDASFIGGWRPFDGGDDGLVYETWARQIAQYLLQGDFWHALEGGESVFFYGGPGLRYLRAGELFVFGDTSLGYLSLILVLPFAVFALFRRFFPDSWALAMILAFVFVPVGVLYGTSFVLYSKWAARGFADPAAFTLFLCGLPFILGRNAAGPNARLAPAFAGALLLAQAVWVRPNLAPLAGVLLGGAGIAALYRHRWRRLAGICLGFAPVLGMALHNWIFGHVFVLFSSNANISQLLVMPPKAWLAAAVELAQVDFGGEHLAVAFSQLTRWLAGPSEMPALIPIHAVAIVVVAWVAGWGRRFDPWLRLVAAAALTQHVVMLCYFSAPRYQFLTWLLTLVVTAVWFRETALPWLQARWPAWCHAAAVHPLSARLHTALTRLQQIAGLTAA